LTFVRAKIGGWVDNVDPISAVQANQLTVNSSRAIDGTSGGEYAPKAEGPIVFTGTQGLEITTGNIELNPRYVIRNQEFEVTFFNPGSWAPDLGNNYQNLVLGSVSFPLKLPHGQVLTFIEARFKGAAGHGFDPVNLGGGITMPRLTLWSVDSSGISTLILSKDDNVIVQSEYESFHTMTLGIRPGFAGVISEAINLTIDAEENRYVLSVLSEGGADFQAGSILASITHYTTCTSYVEH